VLLQEGLTALLAAKAPGVEVDANPLAVHRKVFDKLLVTAKAYQAGMFALWTRCRVNGRLCLDVVVVVGFIDLGNGQAREIQNVHWHEIFGFCVAS
jgi:hypothetical protein